jgi:DNA-binding NarL/FixJ family response regulator
VVAPFSYEPSQHEVGPLYDADSHPVMIHEARRIAAHRSAEHAVQIVRTERRERQRAIAKTVRLTRRELQMAQLACEGRRNAGIAAELGLTAQSVAVRLTEISQKLGTDRHGLRRAFRLYQEQHDAPPSAARRVHRQQEHEHHAAA